MLPNFAQEGILSQQPRTLGRKTFKTLGFILCGALLFAHLSPAQDTPARANAPLTDSSQTSAPALASPVATPPERPLSRWLDLNTLSFSFRDRDTASNIGYHYMEFGQQRSLIDERLKLDHEGKYSVNFHISSGRTFNWAYSDQINGRFEDRVRGLGPYLPPADAQRIRTASAFDPTHAIRFGLPSRGWEMYARQLYFSASPIKQLELQYGSLAIAKGFGSEITSYDEDGYIAGERLRILDPKHLFVDEVSVTYAYEGDIYNPNFFTRGDRLLQSNYHQFLLAKKFGKRLGVSADFTGDKGTHTMREAVLAKVPEARVVDSARLELYQRTNDITLQSAPFPGGSGFAFTGTKTIAKRFRLEAGYADIDDDYGALVGSRLLAVIGFSMNADTFGTGKRAFTRANIQLTPYFNLFGFYTHLTSDVAHLNITNQGFNFGATIDFKEILINKLHVL